MFLPIEMAAIWPTSKRDVAKRLAQLNIFSYISVMAFSMASIEVCITRKL